MHLHLDPHFTHALHRSTLRCIATRHAWCDAAQKGAAAVLTPARRPPDAAIRQNGRPAARPRLAAGEPLVHMRALVCTGVRASAMLCIHRRLEAKPKLHVMLTQSTIAKTHG